jgi:uncharacterized membrane protein
MTAASDTSRLERLLTVVLRAGALASTLLLGAGLLIAMAAPGGAAGPGLISAGLVLLIATPVARVVVSVVGFAAGRDWLFVALTGAVLLVLTGSLLLALGG